MITRLLTAHARLAVIQAGWPVHIRVGEIQRELDAAKPALSRVVSERDPELMRLVTVSRRFGKHVQPLSPVLIRLDGKKIHSGFSLPTDGWEVGAHCINLDVVRDSQTQCVEIPVLILSKDAFWAKFKRDWESKYNHPALSGDISEIHGALADVQTGWHARALKYLGAQVDWTMGASLTQAKGHVLETPVNMWTLYQLLRLIQRLSFEQLFWGGKAGVSLSEEEQLLVVKAEMKADCEIATHFIEMFSRSAPLLPDLKTIAIKVKPSFDISLVAKFPLHHAAGGEIDGRPEVIITGPGGSALEPVLGEFDLNSLKQAA